MEQKEPSLKTQANTNMFLGVARESEREMPCFDLLPLIRYFPKKTIIMGNHCENLPCV